MHDWIKAPGAPGVSTPLCLKPFLGIEVGRPPPPPPPPPPGEMEGAKSFYNVVSELVNLGYLDGSP